LNLSAASEYKWKFLPIKDISGNPVIKTASDYLGDYPEWIKQIWDKTIYQIRQYQELSFVMKERDYPDHLLINKYEIGDGCTKHTDELLFWEEWVVGISFGSGCIFRYENEKQVDIYLPKNSIYILSTDARYKWTHAIPFQGQDIVYGDIVPRDKRFSLTFRNIDKKYLSDETRESVKSYR